MKPIAEIGEVTSNHKISKDTYKLVIESPRIAQGAKAGQFVHVRCGDGYNPFLRRPLSIGPCFDDRLTLIFTVKGEGTRLLAEKRIAQPVDMIGPLGNRFLNPVGDFQNVLVAGGIGVVPLLLLDDQTFKRDKRLFLLGVRSKDMLSLSEEEYIDRGIFLSSDDGSAGYAGTVINLLREKLDEVQGAKVQIYGCGPAPMMAALKEFCVQRSINAQVSLEVPMGCGVGACQSCAVVRDDGNGYLLVCKDGPVFDINEVDLSPGSVI